MQQSSSLELQIAEHKRSHYGCEFCAIVAIFFLGILTLTLPWYEAYTIDYCVKIRIYASA